MKPNPKPQAPPATREPADPYKIRTIEHLFSLFDGGDFLAEVLEGHRQLQVDMLEHKDLHGTKGCKGSMTIMSTTPLANRATWTWAQPPVSTLRKHPPHPHRPSSTKTGK